MEGEEYLNLSLQCYGGNNFEDYDMESDYVRQVVLGALLPEFEIDDLEVYFDSYLADREEEYFQENINLINDFAKKHKIKKKIYKHMIEDQEGVPDTRIFALVIKSNYLKSIYKNSILKDLFEYAIPEGFFLSPTNYLVMMQIYNDGFGDEPQIDKVACIEFIEEYKKLFKRKREYKHNYFYTNQLVEINAFSMASNDQSFISYLLDGVFETRTEVMF